MLFVNVGHKYRHAVPMDMNLTDHPRLMAKSPIYGQKTPINHTFLSIHLVASCKPPGVAPAKPDTSLRSLSIHRRPAAANG